MVALYMQISDKFDGAEVAPMNITCIIEPQLIDVNVTYNGNYNIVTLNDYTVQKTPYIPINTSTAVNSVITALEAHLSEAQSLDRNLIVDGIYQFYSQNYPYPYPDFSPLVPELMVSSSPSKNSS